MLVGCSQKEVSPKSPSTASPSNETNSSSSAESSAEAVDAVSLGSSLSQHRIFYPSGVVDFDFDFGGDLNNADSVCQDHADSQSLGGTWRAWLVPPGGNVKDRIFINGPVYNLMNELVAGNETELYNSPTNAVKYNELLTVGFERDGSYISGVGALQGFDKNGDEVTGYTCSGWSSSSGGAATSISTSLSYWIMSSNGGGKISSPCYSQGATMFCIDQ